MLKDISAKDRALSGVETGCNGIPEGPIISPELGMVSGT